MEQLFRDYLQNRCTAEEVAQVMRYLQTAEGKAKMEAILAEPPPHNKDLTPSNAHIVQGWERLSQYISSTPSSTTVRPLLHKRRWVWAAAIVPLVMAAALGWWLWSSPTDQVARTDYAQLREVHLPDGSRVVLNGNSTLEFKSKWLPFATREVWLTGEAFFEVVHTSSHQKFLVHTRKKHTIEVLGTSFNVFDRPNSTEVSLKSGKIKLHIQQQEATKAVVMQPGQSLTIDTTATKIRLASVKTDRVATWRNRKLVFEATRLADITQMLKETYNLEVTVENPALLNEKVTGVIPSGNVDELLKALSLALKVNYTNQNNQIKFY
ncbi:MAG: FecR family protein [Runella sp.]